MGDSPSEAVKILRPQVTKDIMASSRVFFSIRKASEGFGEVLPMSMRLVHWAIKVLVVETNRRLACSETASDASLRATATSLTC